MMKAPDISFVHLGISIEHLRNSISVFGFEIAYYGIIIGCLLYTSDAADE